MLSWQHERLRMQMWMDGPHLHIDRSSHLPCAVSAVVGKGRKWSTVCSWSYRHNISIAQEGVNVEGKVNKLKLIKRMGYGRAGFALLRQRVLHAL